MNNEEIQYVEKICPFKMVKASNGDVHVEVFGESVLPPEIFAFILDQMRMFAEDYLGREDRGRRHYSSQAFDDSQRQSDS